MCALKTPLLFLVYNRPAETARVFEVIRSQRPSILFVAADGARPDRPGEEASVKQTREIVAQIDWPCELKTLFRDTNLGCSLAVTAAISWFFEHVDEGIILEDDCLPHPDFFSFCATLLERYRPERRVATIGGTHVLPSTLRHAHNHYASKYFAKWGWATWRRTWQQYDFDLRKLSAESCNELLRVTHPLDVECQFWTEKFRSLKAGAVSIWDDQVFFSAWRTGANHLMPGRNLVSNLCSRGASTATNLASSVATIPSQPLSASDDPISLAPDPLLDNLIFYLRFLGSMTDTHWLTQALSPEHQLGDARLALVKKDRLIRQLELEVLEKRRELLAVTKAFTSANKTSNRSI